MPIGPKGEKRPQGVVANAVHVMRLAIGEEEETYEEIPTPRPKRRKVLRKKAVRRRKAVEKEG